MLQNYITIFMKNNKLKIKCKNDLYNLLIPSNMVLFIYYLEINTIKSKYY